jgi:hypothetical protein
MSREDRRRLSRKKKIARDDRIRRLRQNNTKKEKREGVNVPDSGSIT